MKKNIKNINFTNYANINGDIVKCDIMKKYEEDSTVFVKAYYSEYHFEYKYVMQDGILTREEGELLLSKIDIHHGIYVRALNVGPDDFLKEMNTSGDAFYWGARDGFYILKCGHSKTYADSDDWKFIKIKDRVLKVYIYNALF